MNENDEERLNREYTRKWKSGKNPESTVIIRCAKCRLNYPGDFIVPVGHFEQPCQAMIKDDDGISDRCKGQWIKIILEKGEKEDDAWHYEKFIVPSDDLNTEIRNGPIHLVALDKNNLQIWTRELPARIDLHKYISDQYHLITESIKTDVSWTIILKTKKGELVGTCIGYYKKTHLK
jgi:hypothetical protein